MLIKISRTILPPLSLLLILLVSGCGPTIVEPPTHATYSFSNINSLPQDRVTDPNEPTAYAYGQGEHIDLFWGAHPAGETTSSQPTPVKIVAGLVGPFTSIEALKKAVSFDGNVINGRIVTAIPPLQTNTWSNKTVSTQFALPATLAPGYYMLVQTIQTGNMPAASAPTGSIIHIFQK